VYYQSRVWSVLLPASITLLGIGLDYTHSLSAGYGENGICMVQTYTVRLIFYMIPMVVSVAVSLSLMSFTLYKLHRQAEPMRETEEFSNICCPNIRMVALKLLLTYGITEVLGFIQIPGDDYNQLNDSFAFGYTCVRSFRGVTVLFIYISRTHVLMFYRTLVRNVVGRVKRKPTLHHFETSTPHAVVNESSFSGHSKDEDNEHIEPIKTI
jgi:hypothetical protein